MMMVVVMLMLMSVIMSDGDVDVSGEVDNFENR